MTQAQAKNEAQTRANRSGCVVWVAYDADHPSLDWRNRYIACYPCDMPAHASMKSEHKPKRRK